MRYYFVLVFEIFLFYTHSVFCAEYQCSQTDDANSAKLNCNHIPKLDVLPGKGWDSLRSKAMGQVTAITYDKCKTTPDGKLLIPDNTFAEPIKQSEVELFSELIENWSNYTSITSQSFNMDIGFSWSPISLSGSFSSDYIKTKQKQVDDKSTTFRVHARYTLYVIGTEPNTSLDDHLLNLFYTAIEALDRNNTRKADYILELIVRDYGTHMMTRIDAGGIIMKEDFVSRQFVGSYSSSISELRATAGALFGEVFSFGASYKHTTNETLIEGYKRSTTSSKVSSFGGLFFRPNQTVNDWLDSLHNNLVAIDRSGDPLLFAITPYAFPNVSISSLHNLINHFSKAILRFYEYNTHKGCMNCDSPNFDFTANTDSQLCDEPLNKFAFGGIFQTCESYKPYYHDICNGVPLKNPLTGEYSCPENYEPILLRNIREEYRYSWRKYDAYWCVPVKIDLPNNTGVMFGGVYTSKVNNPLTQSGSCPSTYFDLTILNDLHVCISDDYELGRKYSLDFGGFFSCQYGNPLYTSLAKNSSKLTMANSQSSSMNSYVSACPKGYSQHTAIIHEDCLINYCVLSGSFNQHRQMKISLPPFLSYDSLFDSVEENLKPAKSIEPINDGHGISPSGIALVIIELTCLVIILTSCGILIFRKKTVGGGNTESQLIAFNQNNSYSSISEES